MLLDITYRSVNYVQLFLLKGFGHNFSFTHYFIHEK